MEIIAGILFFFICSCTANKKLQEGKRNLELLKQFAYCRCMKQSLQTFSKLDTSEISSGDAQNLIEYYGMYTKNIGPILDSLALTVVKKQIVNKHDRSTLKYESALGETSYILECLNFFNSIRLDSLVKSLPKKSYVVRLSD